MTKRESSERTPAQEPTKNLLTRYRAQHDEDCASNCCAKCDGTRKFHRDILAVLDKPHIFNPKACTCGLDALLASTGVETKSPANWLAARLNELADYAADDPKHQMLGDMIAMMREAARVLQSGVETPTGWQPIESAPKDQVVLVYDEGAISLALWVSINDELFAWHDAQNDAKFDPPPTHWMPLPAAPSASALPAQVFSRDQVEQALAYVSRIDSERILSRLGYTEEEIIHAIR